MRAVISRRVDGLGRIVLPSSIRSFNDIKVGDLMDVFIKDDCIILKKQEALTVRRKLERILESEPETADDEQLIAALKELLK